MKTRGRELGIRFKEQVYGHLGTDETIPVAPHPFCSIFFYFYFHKTHSYITELLYFLKKMGCMFYPKNSRLLVTFIEKSTRSIFISIFFYFISRSARADLSFFFTKAHSLKQSRCVLHLYFYCLVIWLGLVYN